MSDNKRLNVHFGAIARPIAAQLREQRFAFDAWQVKIFQEHEKRIVTLFFAGLLTDGEKGRAYDRLFKQVKEHVESKNK